MSLFFYCTWLGSASYETTPSAMAKVIRVSKTQLNEGFGKNISIQSADDQPKMEVRSHKSSSSFIQKEQSPPAKLGRPSVIIQRLSRKDSNKIVPDDIQRIPSSTGTNKNDLPDYQSLEKDEEKRRRRRRCGPFLCSKLCCCCLAATILFSLGLIATVASIIATRGGQTVTTSTAAVTWSASSDTTSSVSSTTLITTVSTIAATTVATTAATTATTVATTMVTTAATTVSTTVTSTVITTVATTASTTASTTITSTALTTTAIILSPASTANWLKNGDAETGACQSSSGATPPTDWNYSGAISQSYYTNTMYSDQTPTSPGPSNRGQCLFYGQVSATTSMWQTVNLTSSINSVLINNQTVWFNFSAWIGGYSTQDDAAQVALTFLDQTGLVVGSGTTLGPILAADRSSITSLLFRQANGVVPVDARSFKVTVTITRTSGTYNDGSIDNIAVLFYD